MKTNEHLETTEQEEQQDTCAQTRAHESKSNDENESENKSNDVEVVTGEIVENDENLPSEEVEEPSYDLQDIVNPKQYAFLVAIQQTGGNVTRACEAAEIGHRTHYDWLNRDPVYTQVYQKQFERSKDVLEARALERAADGIDDPVFYQGQVVGHRKVYSDNLLMFLLKSRDDKYKDKGGGQGNVGVFGGGDVKIQFNIPRPPEQKRGN